MPARTRTKPSGPRGVELVPNARNLIRALRDLGYDFSQAVADIIDNSIAARAKVVTVEVRFEGENSWVSVADNGSGMSPDRLREAMRLGVDRDYDLDDLGKFGMGLKSASFSQCRRLSVASRTGQRRARITAYSWDIDHIERTNRWEILPARLEDFQEGGWEGLLASTGTVVLWQRLDRILGYSHPYGEAAKKQLAQMCRDLEAHLGMVFHRFLAGEVRGRRISIVLNGNEVKPWDPFCRSERATKRLESVEIPCSSDGKSSNVVLERFVLPSQNAFSSPEAFRLAGGPAKWNLQQGFYIYRANRMIQSGGWSYLQAPDEHTKLARVALSFPPALDEAFKINVAKMRVLLPPIIRADIANAISPVVRQARSTYNASGGRNRDGTDSGHRDKGQSVAMKSSSPSVRARLETGNIVMSFEQWAEQILAVADTDEFAMLQKLLKRIRGMNLQTSEPRAPGGAS